MREQFPIFSAHPHLIYLDTAATAHKPKSVVDALVRGYTQDYATVHRAVYPSAMQMSEAYEQTRETVKEFLHASSSEEIVFTKGTTDAINLVAQSLGQFWLQEGDEIFLSPLEHHSNLVPWQMIAEKTGSIIQWIPCDQNGRMLFDGIFSSRTKLVCIAHMSNVTGIIHPIEQIVQQAHACGAYVCVDGAQAAVHLPVDVKKIGCDFYAFSSHKCYGPTGLGILFGKKAILERMPPVFGGGDMIEQVTKNRILYQKPPLRFEAGTPPIVSVIAFQEALRFLQSPLVRERQHQEISWISSLEKELAQFPSCQILGSAPRGPLLSFSLKGHHPLDIATLLGVENIAVRSGHLCAQMAMEHFRVQAAVRVSLGVYNSQQDIDRFLEALRSIANSLNLI